MVAQEKTVEDSDMGRENYAALEWSGAMTKDSASSSSGSFF